MPDMDPLHARTIGETLRAARQQKQMSLRELAANAEVSASMLSQIETGKAYPSVRSIYSIASALGIPVDNFFPAPAGTSTMVSRSAERALNEMTANELRVAKVNGTTGDDVLEFQSPAQAPTPVVHVTARPTIELKGGITWSRLTALAESGAEFLEVTYASGATSGAHMSHHEGREFGLILEGELTIELGFETYTLHVGDSIIFDSTTPHRLTNKDTQPTRALWVVLSRTPEAH